MTNRETYAVHEPESLMPAPGWRAAYIHPEDEGDPGWSADPLVALAVCHVTNQPCHRSIAKASDEGRQVHGYVNADYIACAEEVSNFWRYLAPGDPDPTPEEVRAEQALLARRRRRTVA